MTREEALKRVDGYLTLALGAYLPIDNCEEVDEILKALKQEPALDKIKDYINHIRNTGLGKKKSLEFLEKYIDGLKAESGNKE